jgi:hypothetical protein
MQHLLIFLFLNTLGPSQVCGNPDMSGLYIEDTAACDDDTEHVCTVGEWPAEWSAAVCCSGAGCRFSPTGACGITETSVCGIVPEPEPEPWICSPLGTTDAYVSDDDSCQVGELHVCTHGDTPASPLALTCCTDDDNCRLVPGDSACVSGEWLACSHAG